MDSWGSSQGFSDWEVFDGVRQHLFRHGGSLRFAITAADDGHVYIRVLPRQRNRDEIGDESPRPERIPSQRQSTTSKAATVMVLDVRTNRLPRLDFKAYPRAGDAATNEGTLAEKTAKLAYSTAHLPREERRARRVGVYGDPPARPTLQPPDWDTTTRPTLPPPPPPPALRLADGGTDDCKPPPGPPPPLRGYARLPGPKGDSADDLDSDDVVVTGEKLVPNRKLHVSQKLNMSLDAVISKEENMVD